VLGWPRGSRRPAPGAARSPPSAPPAGSQPRTPCRNDFMHVCARWQSCREHASENVPQPGTRHWCTCITLIPTHQIHARVFPQRDAQGTPAARQAAATPPMAAPAPAAARPGPAAARAGRSSPAPGTCLRPALPHRPRCKVRGGLSIQPVALTGSRSEHAKSKGGARRRIVKYELVSSSSPQCAR